MYCTTQIDIRVWSHANLSMITTLLNTIPLTLFLQYWFTMQLFYFQTIKPNHATYSMKTLPFNPKLQSGYIPCNRHFATPHSPPHTTPPTQISHHIHPPQPSPHNHSHATLPIQPLSRNPPHSALITQPFPYNSPHTAIPTHPSQHNPPPHSRQHIAYPKQAQLNAYTYAASLCNITILKRFVKTSQCHFE